METFFDWIGGRRLNEMALVNDTGPWVFRGKNERGEFEGGQAFAEKSILEILSDAYPEGLTLDELLRRHGAGKFLDDPEMSNLAKKNARKNLKSQIRSVADKVGIHRVMSPSSGRTLYFFAPGGSAEEVQSRFGHDPEATGIVDLFHELYVYWMRNLSKRRKGSFERAKDFKDRVVEVLRGKRPSVPELYGIVSKSSWQSQIDPEFFWGVVATVFEKLPGLYSEKEKAALLASTLRNLTLRGVDIDTLVSGGLDPSFISLADVWSGEPSLFSPTLSFLKAYPKDYRSLLPVMGRSLKKAGESNIRAALQSMTPDLDEERKALENHLLGND